MLRTAIKRMPLVQEYARALKIFFEGFHWRRIFALIWFFRDYSRLRRTPNPKFKRILFTPYLDDRTALTPIDPVYFFQNSWMAKKLFEIRPTHHVDVGSSAMALGMLSQFFPITMVDIRPLPLSVSGLRFVEGSIIALPFADASIPSISSLCVIEHIGLGRYGDSIDAFGSEKAALELQRVTSPGGTILFSVPMDSENRIYFNAHRAFTRDTVLLLFKDFELLEERYQYGYDFCEKYQANRGFGTGLFLFRKN